MADVHCPFCGAPVHLGPDGQAEPLCPRCGAWVVTHPATGGSGLGAVQALDERAVPGPQGEVRFVRAPFSADAPADWLGDG